MEKELPERCRLPILGAGVLFAYASNVKANFGSNKHRLQNLSIFLKNLQITLRKMRRVTRFLKPVQKSRIQLYLQNATRYAMPPAPAKRESRTSRKWAGPTLRSVLKHVRTKACPRGT
jgi:hypothetical protein